MRLSKDSMNQLDQVSIPKQDAAASGDHFTPEVLSDATPAGISGNTEGLSHAAAASQADGDTAGNETAAHHDDGGSSSHGGYGSVSEMKRNGLTMGTSGDLDALFADSEADYSNGTRRPGSSSNGISPVVSCCRLFVSSCSTVSIIKWYVIDPVLL